MTSPAIALRVARAVKNWSRAELARICGIAESSIEDYELGNCCPSPNNLDVIRAAIGHELATAEEHYGAIETRTRGRPRIHA